MMDIDQDLPGRGLPYYLFSSFIKQPSFVSEFDGHIP